MIRCAAFTTDGGQTWQTSLEQPSGFRSGVAFLGGDAHAHHCISVGTNGADLSADAGRTWRRIRNTGYHAIAFAPETPIGWAVGSDGRIARIEAH